MKTKEALSANLADTDAEIISLARQIRDRSEARDTVTMIYPTFLFRELATALRSRDEITVELAAASGGAS